MDGREDWGVRAVRGGWTEVWFHPEMQLTARQVKLGTDAFKCAKCGAAVAAETDGARDAERNTQSSSSAAGGANSTSFGMTTKAEGANDGATSPPMQAAAWGICPGCGEDLGEDDFVAAEVVTVPAVQTVLRVPNGQEVITIVGALELKTPPWANEMHEYPYLQWNMEVHQARLRAAYPHAADQIGSPVVAGAGEQYERLARLAQSQGGPLTEGGDTNLNLITFSRTWLRPWSFYALEDKTLRDEMLALFPDGCACSFAGDAYCEARNENMDDHWRVMHAMPGMEARGVRRWGIR